MNKQPSTCQNCVFFKPEKESNAGLCLSLPKPCTKYRTDWCGEHKTMPLPLGVPYDPDYIIILIDSTGVTASGVYEVTQRIADKVFFRDDENVHRHVTLAEQGSTWNEYVYDPRAE